MARIDPRVHARRVLVADTRPAIARILDSSGLTTAEQVMVLGGLVVSTAGASVATEREKLSGTPGTPPPGVPDAVKGR